MARIYYNQLLKQNITFDKVPLNWKNAVRELAMQDVESGRINTDFYRQIIGEDY